MIVLSMTTEEVYREIMRDFEIIKRRSYLEGKILHKENRSNSDKAIKSYPSIFPQQYQPLL